MNDSMAKPLKVLYVAGESRSGSTLLDCLLGQSAGYFSCGELNLIWRQGFMENLLCGCGRPLQACEFWSAVIEQAFGGWSKVDPALPQQAWLALSRLRRFPLMLMPAVTIRQAQRQHVARLIDHWGRLYRAVQQVSGCEVIIDSSKSPMGAFFLNQIPGIELSIVHLVRDSRAVAHSMQRHKVRPEVTNSTAYMLKIHPLKASVFWNANNLIANSLRLTNSRYYRLRYRQLVEQPQTVLTQLGQFMGVPVDLSAFVDSQTVVLGDNHTVAGNPSRFKRGSIKVEYDREWLDKMPWPTKLQVTAMTWPLLLSYGYFRHVRGKWRKMLAMALLSFTLLNGLG